MKKRAQSRPNKELTRLKAQLTLRERQFGFLCAALKTIVQFKSARLSVFSTEVQELQGMAWAGLILAEQAQLGKDVHGKTLIRADKRLAVKKRLSKLYERFGSSLPDVED